MQSHTIRSVNANTNAENFIMSLYPKLSYSSLQKAFRKRDIKVNGIRVGKDYQLNPGDVLEIYITDDILMGSAKRTDSVPQPGFTVVYEDENLLLVNKKQGIPVHPDKEQSRDTLIDQVRYYLKQSNAQAERTDQFQPSLCHRLDRNTGGLVIIAKNSAAHEIILKKIETGEIQKFYKCLVSGCPEKKEAMLKAYLWKDAAKNRVFIYNNKTKGSVDIATSYKVLEYNPAKDVSLLEVELLTGRTHQIRAHMAFIGHPILGDGKYGQNSINRAFGLKMQALWAYKLKFNFRGSSMLDYLDHHEFTVEPDFDIKKL
jgi:23S rRNA pseudouridine955/2504/2580 synthase